MDVLYKLMLLCVGLILIVTYPVTFLLNFFTPWPYLMALITLGYALSFALILLDYVLPKAFDYWTKGEPD